MEKRNLDQVSNSVDVASPTPVICDQITKHRTCWLHVVAFLYARKMKISKQRLKRIEGTAPCFLGTFHQCKRSKRRAKPKKAITKYKKMMNSGEFECYLEKMWKSFPDDRKASFTYIDPLWFHLYLKESSRERVLTWIKRRNIFLKKYVFVPIVCWSHWCLLILCHFGENLQSETRIPCMLLLDSLKMANPRRFEPNIRKFVLDLYKTENRPETKQLIYKIPLLLPEVPQQISAEECGNFVLYYINLFVKDAPDNFNMDGYPYFMNKGWFTQQNLESFCERLDSLKN